MTDSDEEAVQKFESERERFYALVGHCILQYQVIEDYLQDIFAAALGGNRSRADAIFDTAKGVDRKIEIIAAAATAHAGEPWDRLPNLLQRVRAASSTRGQIAHAQPIRHGGTVRLNFRRDSENRIRPTRAEQIEGARWELHKRARTTKIFQEIDLRQESLSLNNLFEEMVDFAAESRAE